MNRFYLFIFYFEKFSTWIWRLPFAVYVNLINSPFSSRNCTKMRGARAKLFVLPIQRIAFLTFLFSSPSWHLKVPVCASDHSYFGLFYHPGHLSMVKLKRKLLATDQAWRPCLKMIDICRELYKTSRFVDCYMWFCLWSQNYWNMALKPQLMFPVKDGFKGASAATMTMAYNTSPLNWVRRARSNFIAIHYYSNSLNASSIGQFFLVLNR